MSTVGLLTETEDMQSPSISKGPSSEKADIESQFLLDETEGSCIKSLSNQTVLGITCLLFFLFVVAEIIGALVIIYNA